MARVTYVPLGESTDEATANYVAINKEHWDGRVQAHLGAADYAVDRLLSGPDQLSDVVAFDVPRLPDLSGLRGVHLQCHIGTDTLSLARLGAQMSGLDFSEPGIEAARDIARRAGVEIDYHVAEVYDAAQVLEPASYDFVFTGIGAICWLPSIDKWAETVASLLKPGGQLFFREGHPVLWTIDETKEDRLEIHFPYFGTGKGIVWEGEGSYVETEEEIGTSQTVDFMHALSEIFTALMKQGMQITLFEEHRSIPWNGLPGRMERTAPHDEWQLIEGRDRLPLSYTLHARLPDA